MRFFYINCQNPIQIKPKTPIIINAISQAKFAAMTGIVIGAAKAPIVAPALKILVAKVFTKGVSRVY